MINCSINNFKYLYKVLEEIIFIYLITFII